MPWNDFIGNEAAVEQLRRLIGEQKARRTVVLAGPDGIGKTTMAWMLGLSLNCAAPPAPGEFCGTCRSCTQATPAGNLDRLAEEALEYRAGEVKSNARESAPLQIAPHPALRYYPPDGDFLSLPQARALIHQSQLQPDVGQTWTLIVGGLDRARWTTQAALLKTLEEPPPGVAIVALASNPLALLPTVRSRALVVRLAPVPADALAGRLVARGVKAEEAAQRARMSAGCPGRALTMNFERYQQIRHEALALLRAGTGANWAHMAQGLHLSESCRSDKEKFESLVEILYSVLQDIEYLQSGFSEAIRHTDCLPELAQLAQRLTPDELPQAIEGLDRIQAAAGRNIFRPLALDNWVLALGHGAKPRPGVGA